MSYSIFTVCNLNYLPRALVLADSVFEHHNRKLKIFIFDKKDEFLKIESNVDICWMEDIGPFNYLSLAFKYDIIEFSTSLKPYITKYLLKSASKVIFLDPDTQLFSDLSSILEGLDKFPIILTPHYTSPQPLVESESDLAMMRFGSFNLGFFAVNSSSEALQFLDWWDGRCQKYSYMESQYGLSTDQKWVSIAPCFFENLHVSFDLGINVAPWNLFERDVSYDSNIGYLINEKYKLKMFHFSNFSHDDLSYSNARTSNMKGIELPNINKLMAEYSKKLQNYESKYNSFVYAYDYFDNGIYVTPTMRRAFSSRLDSFKLISNPFDSTSEVYKFGVLNGIVGKKFGAYKMRKNLINQKGIYEKEVWIFNLLLRIINYIFGPNKLHDFTKFLVLMSILRMNKTLWKWK